MNDGTLEFPFAAALPARGEVLEVAPGVLWLRMPLPFALDHVNLWLLHDRLDGHGGWAIVDCGIADAATREAWQAVSAGALGGEPVLRVIVTHFHPDHMGLAHWLTQRWTTPERTCRLWTSEGTWQSASAASADSDIGGEAAAAFFRLHGLTDPESLRLVGERGRYYARLVPAIPAAFTRIGDGMALDLAGREWQCIAAHGHAPEHVCLYSASQGLLVSGDIILPAISTNVSVVWRDPGANPLQSYLASIARLRELPADTLVLPSHGRPFRGLHERIAQLEAHHRERLAVVLDACAAEPRSAAELLAVLFRRTLDLHQLTFAMGEAIAHLRALEVAGELVAERDRDDDVLRFHAPRG